MSLLVLKSLFVLLIVAGSLAMISRDCIDCIGKVEGRKRVCTGDPADPSCGLYQIKERYWKDCATGLSWRLTADDELQARQCISNYMNRYGYLCARALGKNVHSLTCEDFARLHNGGPNGCATKLTLPYLQTMKMKC